ncbi:MAG: helicase, partial [Phycisphaerae bacterium]
MVDVLSVKLSDMQLRAKLEEMVLNDLLGPAGGPEEEIAERNVHDRYLVGILAPHDQTEVAPAKPTRQQEPDEDEEGDTPSLTDELAEGGNDTTDDGKTDQDVPVTQAHYPSSIGMTFCVDLSAKAIKVEGTWGQYLRVKTEEGEKPVWKRKPRGGSIEIPLKVTAKAMTIQPTELDPEVDGVFVQGVIRKRDHHFVITLFFVNGQALGKPKDQFFVFQPVLKVTAPDGAAIFCKKLERRHSSDPATKLDEERMAMLYRHHVEFAVGHGVSVHAQVAPNSTDQAVMVQTTLVPTYEVPKTTESSAKDAALNVAFEKLGSVVLDMKELAD